MNFKRNFLNTDELPCDLFKLEVASGRVNHGISKDEPYWTTSEHSHFYRTIDSDGRHLKDCSACVGHKHEIIISKDKKGDIIDVKCGPADWTNDNHVHDVTYKYSSKVKQRVWDSNIARMATNESAD